MITIVEVKDLIQVTNSYTLSVFNTNNIKLDKD